MKVFRLISAILPCGKCILGLNCYLQIRALKISRSLEEENIWQGQVIYWEHYSTKQDHCTSERLCRQLLQFLQQHQRFPKHPLVTCLPLNWLCVPMGILTEILWHSFELLHHPIILEICSRGSEFILKN